MTCPDIPPPKEQFKCTDIKFVGITLPTIHPIIKGVFIPKNGFYIIEAKKAMRDAGLTFTQIQQSLKLWL